MFKLPSFYCLLLLIVFAGRPAHSDDQVAAMNHSDDLESVTLQLKWKHQFQFAGFYAALEQGYYKEAGLDVDIVPANYDTDPIEEVLSGNAQFGLANSELALYRMRGKPLIALASIIQHSPIVLMTLKDANIYSPQDLIGKRVMYPPGEYGANTLGIMLREGIHPSQFESIPLSFNLDDLISGRVDAMVGYITDQPHQLEKRGVEYRLIDPRSYGVDFYGDTLFTTQSFLEGRPEQVQSFKDASLKGWRYAINHPEELVQLIKTKYQSELSLEQLRYEAQETISLIVPKLVDLGHMNPGRWQHIAETFNDLGMTTGTLDLDAFLFQPAHLRNQLRLNKVTQIALIAIAIAMAIVCIMALFNRRLKRIVELKTQDLHNNNEALRNTAKQLSVKESALNRLNQTLEQRIEERTASLDEANRDLTSEIEQRKRNERSLALLHQAIDCSNSAVLVLRKDLSIRYASAAVLRHTELSQEQLINQNISVLNAHIDLPGKALSELLEMTGGRVFREVQTTNAQGMKRWLQLSISPMKLDPDEISHFVLVFEDVTELKRSKDEMEQRALHDPLTGLDNRILFQAKLDKAIHQAKRNAGKSALLFIDIDNFKMINDSLGHEGGDFVLKKIAERLTHLVRENDPVARISGDEFAIILSDIHNYGDASRVTQNILRAFEQPITLDGKEVFVTTSIGVSITPDDANQREQLIRNADMAMYQAKETGRNNYQFYNEQMNLALRAKSEIEKGLRAAIEQQAFFIEYQPIIDLSSRQVIGVEALLRWRSDADNANKTVRRPEEFLEVAEETGLIIPIGDWVIRQVLADHDKLKALGYNHLRFAINLSSRQVKDPRMIESLTQAFKASQAEASAFNLEITESCLLDQRSASMDNLRALTELGFSLSLDDFGSGYSSITHLLDLPIKSVKIEGKLVSRLNNKGDSEAKKLVTSIIETARALEKTVIAESVEDAHQSAFLVDQKCAQAQGYFFYKPMPLDDLIRQLSDNKLLNFSS